MIDIQIYVPPSGNYQAIPVYNTSQITIVQKCDNGCNCGNGSDTIIVTLKYRSKE